MRILLVLVIALSLSTPLAAQMPSTLSLMPVPAKVQAGSGQLLIDQSFTAASTGTSDARLERGIARFLDQLEPPDWNASHRPSHPTRPMRRLTIQAQSPGNRVQELGEDESYTLEINASHAALTAPTALGALHGLQTFLQLVAPTSTGFAVPVVTIQDQPRFPWRGLLIDVSRHFFPMEVLKRNLDGMAALKMNVSALASLRRRGLPRREQEASPSCRSWVRTALTTRRRRSAISLPTRAIAESASFPSSICRDTAAPGWPPIPTWRACPVLTKPAGLRTPIPSWIRPARGLTSFSTSSSPRWRALFPDAYFHIGGDEVNHQAVGLQSQDPGVHSGARHEETTATCKPISISACRRSSPSTKRS